MTGRIARVGLILHVLLVSSPGGAAEWPLPEEARLKAHVTTLASPEFLGRRGEGARKAADYVVDAFRALKLEPLFDGKFEQPIPGREPGEITGRNVGAILRGSDPKLRDQWVIVSAHFDHLGVRGGVLYPGADDNASGVAMMLEIARTMTHAPEKPRRSLMFIGFDLEEIGLFGSRYFVEHAPVPLDRVTLFITADMIGRSLGGVCEGKVFVMGSEHAPGLRSWISESAQGLAVKVGTLGSDLLILNRSDYGPFRAKHVPYLFFSTGENPLYHTPGDTAETVDYPKAEAISRIIHGVVKRAVIEENSPKWNSAPDNPLEEAITIREVMRCLLAHREKLKIGAAQVALMSNSVRNVDAIEARGTITPAERNVLVQVARIVLATVF